MFGSLLSGPIVSSFMSGMSGGGNASGVTSPTTAPGSMSMNNTGFQPSAVGGDLLNIGTNFVNKKLTEALNGSPGEQHKEFMDDAYPGTTPWERLGGSTGAGSIASSQQSASASRYGADKVAETADKNRSITASKALAEIAELDARTQSHIKDLGVKAAQAHKLLNEAKVAGKIEDIKALELKYQQARSAYNEGLIKLELSPKTNQHLMSNLGVWIGEKLVPIQDINTPESFDPPTGRIPLAR